MMVGSRVLLFFKFKYLINIISIVQVWFQPTSYTVDEDAGTVTLIVMTNVPGGPSGGGVEFYTVDDTATCMCLSFPAIYTLVNMLTIHSLAPGDFGGVSSVPVVFNQGSTVTTVTVSINDDNILEIDEEFLGELVYTGSQTVTIVQDEAVVTIVDNDGEMIIFNIKLIKK